MDIMQILREKAQKKQPRIVFPEAQDPKIVEAAVECLEMGIAKPILLGDQEQISGFGFDVRNIEIVQPEADEAKMDAYAERFSTEQGLPAKNVKRRLKTYLNYAAMMVHVGEADGLVAGLIHSTEDVIMACQMYVGLAENVKIASSYFLMELPNKSLGEQGLLMFSDCGVVPNPNSEELASIARTTADSARCLLDWEPRVAMISFSTRGSATHPDVDKVLAALEIVQHEEPELLIDGELQVDAAIIPEVSDRKVKENNVLHGRANILIFPDLDAGNSAYKLTQRLAGANAYGPMLQGFARPVSDLSRGSTVQDIIGVTTIVAAQM